MNLQGIVNTVRTERYFWAVCRSVGLSVVTFTIYAWIWGNSTRIKRRIFDDLQKLFFYRLTPCLRIVLCSPLYLSSVNPASLLFPFFGEGNNPKPLAPSRAVYYGCPTETPPLHSRLCPFRSSGPSLFRRLPASSGTTSSAYSFSYRPSHRPIRDCILYQHGTLMLVH